MTHGERSVRPSEESCLNPPGVGGISAKVQGTSDEETSQDDEDEVMEEKEREEIEIDQVTKAPIKIAKDPSKPTLEEVAEHDPTHIPYRSWCTVCVEASGKEDQ